MLSLLFYLYSCIFNPLPLSMGEAYLYDGTMITSYYIAQKDFEDVIWVSDQLILANQKGVYAWLV